jgi:UDP-N-acetylmuramate: L-alanyl-gamma-D-glutamyl-meso-diaminopimelate ligase
VDNNGKVRRIHLLGVGGTGMGSFAGLLKAAGYEVTGSDQQVYPPMSQMLEAWGIQVLYPYSPANLEKARPDLVIVGNVIRSENPEAEAVREQNLPQMSFPAALDELFLQQRHSVVVAGTHGKTTTSALMAHVLVAAGKDPSFLVGGVARNYDANYRLGRGPHFVVEGDEYDTAYFDKGPKFLHYRPRTAILTSVELDHADIYRDLAHYQSAFENFVRLLPESGTLAVSASYPNAVEIARIAAANVVLYSGREGVSADYTARGVSFSAKGARLTIVERGKPLGELELGIGGSHNVENALGVFAAARELGLSPEEIGRGFASFRGVRRRQEVLGELDGILVVDDFAHHPTAVRETVSAIHLQYPSRKIWAVFEPRSNTSRRNLHQQEYAGAFGGAARASIKVPEHHDKVPRDQELDVPKLLQELRQRGIEADSAVDVQQLVDQVSNSARPGDLVLAMSNGSFGGFVDKLLKALSSRKPRQV